MNYIEYLVIGVVLIVILLAILKATKKDAGLDFNKLVVDGEYGLEVDQAHSVQLSIGYQGNGRVKIQITTKENTDKVETEVIPPLIHLKKKEMDVSLQFHLHN